MSKRVAVSAASIKMPKCCAVCLDERVSGSYEITRTLVDGLQRATINIEVPLCASDLKTASWVSPRETLAQRVGIVTGILLSLLLGWLFFDATATSSGLIHWLLSPILCIGAIVGTFPLVMRIIAPKFVHPKTKHVREAVVIARYVQGAVELLIDNEKFAGRVIAENERR